MTIGRRTLAAASLAAGVTLPASAKAQPAQGRMPQADAAAPALPTTFAQVTKPADGVIMPEGYVRAIAQFAYAWAWPMVNQWNRRASIIQAPHPGLNGGVLPVAPRGRIAMLVDYILPQQEFVTCPNQDVVYGMGYFALDTEPVVIQVPDFGDRFWVYALYDGRTDQFGELGKQYGTRPGFYLIVGPGWQGQVPQGIAAVVRSPTDLANVVPRIFLNDTAEDRRAIRPAVNQVVVYPLNEFDGRMKTVDYAALPHFPAPPATGEEIKWVDPQQFFAQLPVVLDATPPLPGEEAVYATVRQVLNAAKRDPAIARLLADIAAVAEREVVAPFFEWRHNGVPAGNNWNRSTNNAQFGVDYFNRLGTAKSNMFDNRPVETQYFYTDFDAAGARLHGANSYAVTFPAGQTPPVNGFWSLTLYNDRHLFHVNPLNRYSLGTKNTQLVRNADGSLTLYAGKDNPGPGREANWLPAPDGNFSLYIRAYWGQPAILDGSWQPPKVEKR